MQFYHLQFKIKYFPLWPEQAHLAVRALWPNAELQLMHLMNLAVSLASLYPFFALKYVAPNHVIWMPLLVQVLSRQAFLEGGRTLLDCGGGSGACQAMGPSMLTSVGSGSQSVASLWDSSSFLSSGWTRCCPAGRVALALTYCTHKGLVGVLWGSNGDTGFVGQAYIFALYRC